MNNQDLKIFESDTLIKSFQDVQSKNLCRDILNLDNAGGI